MNTLDLLSHLRSLGVQLSLDGERLRLNAPKGVLTPGLQADLSTRKSEILAFLQKAHNSQAYTIPILDRTHKLPLSLAQERIWSLTQLTPASPVYNMYLCYEISGKLNIGALEHALGDIRARHEVLRSSYPSIQGSAQAYIYPPMPWNIDIHSLRHAQNQADTLRDYALQHILKPFDLAHDQLLRIDLAQLADDHWLLTMVMHHIIADGWAWGIFLRELSLAYEAAYKRQPLILPGLACQYVDLAAWQRQQIAEGKQQSHLEYWHSQLQHLPDALALPPDHSRVQARHGGTRQHQLIPAHICIALRELCHKQGVTLYTVLLAAYSASLIAATQRQEVTICTPMVNRMLPEVQNLIGYFNTIVPLRLSIQDQPTYVELIQHTQQIIQAAYTHQDVVYEQLADISPAVRRTLSHVLLVLQDATEQSLNLFEAKLSPLELYAGQASFDCFITIMDHNATLSIVAEYKSERYRSETIQALLQAYTDTIEHMVCNPDLPIAGKQWRTNQAQGRNSVGTQLPPRTALESELKGIWTRILGIEHIGVQDSFFDLGGDSLLALRLVTRIEEQIGVNLPLATLIHEPTITHMAALIEKGGHDQLWRPLVALQPQGSKPPFFAIHGVHGNILFWRDLARYLGPDQPFYALQSRGIDGFQKPLRSISAMAEWYVREIKTVQAQGPYYLGGYSLGGEIAFEIAQQLQAMGDRVAFLVLLDTMNPDRPIRRRGLPLKEQAGEAGIAILPKRSLLWQKVLGHARRLHGLSPRQQIRYLYGDLRMRLQRRYRHHKIADYQQHGRRLPPDLLLWYLEESHTAALLAYQPQPFAGHLTLFRTHESLAYNPLNSPFGWEALAHTSETHLFDSPHRMVDAAYIGKLVVQLQACLSKARSALELSE